MSHGLPFDVSRETSARLDSHLALLERWNPRINLVSRGSLAEARQRHFADSAQLWLHKPDGARHWLDMGSGAGFPGLVIAILAAEKEPELRVTLVESDQRKAIFLRTVVREVGLSVAVHDVRIEALSRVDADVISARALAPLATLLEWSEIHRRDAGICLFPKGQTVHNEIVDAGRRWRFEHRLHPSSTDPGAAIVEIGAFTRA